MQGRLHDVARVVLRSDGAQCGGVVLQGVYRLPHTWTGIVQILSQAVLKEIKTNSDNAVTIDFSNTLQSYL